LHHLHQDLFGEASYFGKGIYDVRAFEASTGGRFEDNAILSHDLLEGCYAHAAMVADVCLMEDSPADYGGDVRRRHRWMRGDWQNLLWAMRTRSERLSLLSLWKITENVRRNMVSLSLFWLAAVGFFLAPDVTRWTACALSVVVLPHALCSAREWWRLCQRVRSGWIGWIDLAEGCARLACRLALRSVFVVAVLPFEALIAVDAALRSTWRWLFSGRRLLEWLPFADSSPGAPSAGAYVGLMRGHLAVTATVALLLTILRPVAFGVAAPLILAWLLAPLFAWSVSRPRPGASDDPLMRLLIETRCKPHRARPSRRRPRGSAAGRSRSHPGTAVPEGLLGSRARVAPGAARVAVRRRRPIDSPTVDPRSG
jgi:cyclic beta-1,2-glucan synthetase